MDKEFLLTVEHSVRPTANGGIIVVIRPPNHRMGEMIQGELSFSTPVDYLAYLAENYTEQQRQKQSEDGEHNTTTFGELK